MQKLGHYAWPGNVRELMNAVERAVVLSRTDMVDADELVFPMADQISSNDPALGSLSKPAGGAENLPLEEVEKRSILKALEATGGNKSEAARRLGITRKTLRKKLEKYEQADK
jgi:two-component system response regulator HydG